jgi:threonine dehydrogenase-like Zn-dependent dehydrogenase
VTTSTTQVARRARFLGAGRIDFEEVNLGPLAEGEVRVEVAVCALCGSDKRLLESGSSVVPGHEIAGTVVEAGPGADVAPGSRVLVYIPVFCGHCDQCGRGETNRCLNLSELVGWQRDGGFATHVDVPAQCLIPVPDDISFDVAVLGLDTVGTAAHALRLALRTQPGPLESLGVIGCGPLGLGVIGVAAAMGLPTPQAHDPHPGRLASAVHLGAVAIDDFSTPNQFDVVVEVSGAAAARETAQNLVRPGGAVVALGESNEPYLMPATPRWRRTDCFTVRSFYFPTYEAEENWPLLREQGAALRDLLSKPMSLDELPGAFAAFVAGDYLKPYIVMEKTA